MYSKIALASSILVVHRCRLSSSTCIRPQKDSIIALSRAVPVRPTPCVRWSQLRRWKHGAFLDKHESIPIWSMCFGGCGNRLGEWEECFVMGCAWELGREGTMRTQAAARSMRLHVGAGLGFPVGELACYGSRGTRNGVAR
jgi:hypothetical protein